VTTLFGSPQTTPKSKHSLLPLLVVLFLFSYGLMTLLIVEQGSTITSQRVLIRELLGDTHELAALKGKQLREQALSRQAQSKTQASTGQSPMTQTPLAQAPSSPSAQAPSSQGSTAQAGTAKNHPGKMQGPAPAKPASDIADARRNLMSI